MKNSKDNSLIISSSKPIVKIEDCILSKLPSLAKIRKEKGDDKTLSFIKLQLIELNELLNLRDQ